MKAQFNISLEGNILYSFQANLLFWKKGNPRHIFHGGSGHMERLVTTKRHSFPELCISPSGRSGCPWDSLSFQLEASCQVPIFLLRHGGIC